MYSCFCFVLSRILFSLFYLFLQFFWEIQLVVDAKSVLFYQVVLRVYIEI